MSSEQELIERVRRKFPSRAGNELRLGIGDDAAVIRPGRRAEWVLTTDAFIENVHFLPKVHSAKDAGYKALARAASDLAAMGAPPRYFLMNLALPTARAGKWLDDFLDGMSHAARRFGLVLAGGDTTKDPHVAINLTLLGAVRPGRAVLRSGARPGNLICVSGKLGQAELGLRLVKLGLHNREQWKHLLVKHFRPEPRLALGQYLSKNRLACAMIDISDGFSTDLAHICAASGVGARINLGRVPMVSIPEKLRRLGLDPISLALHGGEDYELLFTVPRSAVRRLPRKFDGLPITIIGEVTRDKRILLIDPASRTKPLPAGGWDPFHSRRKG